jgi:hypothetical protein
MSHSSELGLNGDLAAIVGAATILSVVSMRCIERSEGRPHIIVVTRARRDAYLSNIKKVR